MTLWQVTPSSFYKLRIILIIGVVMLWSWDYWILGVVRIWYVRGRVWGEYSYSSLVAEENDRREGIVISPSRRIHPFGDGQLIRWVSVYLVCLYALCRDMFVHIICSKLHLINFNVCFQILSTLSGRINIHLSQRDNFPLDLIHIIVLSSFRYLRDFLTNKIVQHSVATNIPPASRIPFTVPPK